MPLRPAVGLPPTRGLLAALLLAAAGLGCGSLSVTEEQELGDEAARELRRELDFVSDPWIREYVETLGEEIAGASGPQPYAFRFHVVEDDSLNAFALPAGHIYIHTGIILAAADVSELAGVIAHEVGHVALRHVARNYRRQRNTSILYQIGALATGIFVGGDLARGGELLGEVAAVAYLNTFTRAAEEEADAFAVETLPRAGYHPNGLVSFFETLQASDDNHMPEFLSSHPTTDSRIEETAARVAEASLPPGLTVRDDGMLQIIQRRIELLSGEAAAL